MQWVPTGDVLFTQASQIAVRLVDELTGNAPIGPLQVRLEVQTADGTWHRMDDTPCTITPSYVVVCPGLERRSEIPEPPRPRRYRLIVEAEYYIPFYPAVRPAAGTTGLEVEVFPHNAAHPPPVPDAPQTLYLLPAPTYPFASHMRVLRGRVVDASGAPVAGAFVREGSRERVLTDAGGIFALPLRWPKPTATISIDADDRAGMTGSIEITLPGALEQGHTIVITPS